MNPSNPARLHHLDTRAALLHRLVDATGCEASRYHAQDAEYRAADARTAAETWPANAATRRQGHARSEGADRS